LESTSTLGLCYNDNLGISSTADLSGQFGSSSSTSSSSTDLGTVPMSGNEDLFVKLSMSAISLLFTSVDPLDELPAECDFSIQDTDSNTLVSMSVTLRPIGSSASIIPRPAQDITLRFQGFDQVSKDTDAPIYDYSLAFGAGREDRLEANFTF